MMLDTLKSEFRKLITVRSTYFITAIALLLIGFFWFYVVGFKAAPQDVVSAHWLSNNITSAVMNVSIFCAIIAILLMTHEYRYNTIMHTLTSSNSRTKVLVAKVLVLSGYAVLFVILMAFVGGLASYLGAQLKDLPVAAQQIPYSDILWRMFYLGWSTAMIAFILAVVIRSQVGAIVALFLLPTLEQLLSILLKENTIYLPFMAQSAVLSAPRPDIGTLSPGKAALIFLLYLIGGWLVAWFLFLRRDAT